MSNVSRSPSTLLWRTVRLQNARDRLAVGHPLFAAGQALRREANQALAAGPFSVMDKPFTPPSGDKHDYLSVGPYWWPNPDTDDGLPYVRRDGEVNPERYQYDNVPLSALIEAVTVLGLGYFFFEDERYAKHAILLLQTWFIDPATRMNPHLQFGQAIPGICDGRQIGIIDTRALGQVLDATCLLSSAPGWRNELQAGFLTWCRAYLNWLWESEFGQAERATHNNHGTWYDVQAAALALFVGEDVIATEILKQVPERRIVPHLAPDGRQPHELARTRSKNYSTMNLLGLFDLARLGEHVGLDLWHFQHPNGQRLQQGLDWLAGQIFDDQPWPYAQISPFDPKSLLPLLLQAQEVYQNERYTIWLEKLWPLQEREERVWLLYDSPPAA